MHRREHGNRYKYTPIRFTPQEGNTMSGINVVVQPVLIDDPEKVLPYLGDRVQVVSTPCYGAVVHAAILALRSIERGTIHAKTPGGELLLRLSGTLQIREAIEKNGVKRGLNYLVVFGSEKDAEEIIESLNLTRTTPIECSPEALKSIFEKSAIVEVL